MNLFYKAFTLLYPLAIKVASPFNRKAKLWVDGRKNIFEKIKQSIDHSSPLLWMHCSSLGEFEQGRTVLEKVKSHPAAGGTNFKVLITFFSPSGYEVRKNYEHADYVFYLPMDSRENVEKFFDIVEPSLIIFVKYEFWFHYLNEAKNRNIPLLLISAIFRKSQPFFKKYGDFHRSILSCFTHLFVQDENSVELLHTINVDNVSLAGDTRFDRVVEIAENFESIISIENFIGNNKVIVAGSTWLEDDKELAHFVNSNAEVKFIIAPHNIEQERLNECLKLYKKSVLFSNLISGIKADINTVIIDNMGMLSRLYKYADIAYVGGGFGGDGVHNVLEPAVFGKPIVMGPEYEKFIEAEQLVEKGAAISIENIMQLEETFNELLVMDDNHYQMCIASKEYVYSRKGATEIIVRYIQENRLLTS